MQELKPPSPSTLSDFVTVECSCKRPEPSADLASDCSECGWYWYVVHTRADCSCLPRALVARDVKIPGGVLVPGSAGRSCGAPLLR